MDCSPNPLTDQELVAACLKGERRAFSELVCRYRDGVVNVVYRMCGDGEISEEAAQEAFIRAWQKLGSYQSRYPFRPWLYRIALNVALDVLRREPQTTPIDAPEMENRLRAESEEPEAAVIRRERAARVRKSVLRLPEASRAVLVLREYEGLSYQEIADVLNIPLGTVMSRLNYARTQLRKELVDETAQVNVNQEAA